MHSLVAAADPSAHPTPTGIGILIPALPDIIWSTVCLVVILVVLWRVMPKVKAVLDDRAQLIEGRIAEAEKLQHETKELLEKQTAELTAARTEAAEIRETARTEGTQIIAELKQQAQAEADRILANTTRQIESERQTVVVSLREDIGQIATSLAEKIVGESLTDSARQSRMVDAFLADLEAAESPEASDKKG